MTITKKQKLSNLLKESIAEGKYKNEQIMKKGKEILRKKRAKVVAVTEAWAEEVLAPALKNSAAKGHKRIPMSNIPGVVKDIPYDEDYYLEFKNQTVKLYPVVKYLRDLGLEICYKNEIGGVVPYIYL